MIDYQYLGGAYWLEKDESNLSIFVSWLTEEDILAMDDAFGNLHDYSADIIARENPYLFTGREYDWQTGLYYYRARSYSSELGRFLQRDPEGMVDGANMYVYCGNDPVNKNDPKGESWWCRHWAVSRGAYWYLTQKSSLHTGHGWRIHFAIGCYIAREGCSRADTYDAGWHVEWWMETFKGAESSVYDVIAVMWGWYYYRQGQYHYNWYGKRIYHTSCPDLAKQMISLDSNGNEITSSGVAYQINNGYWPPSYQW